MLLSEHSHQGIVISDSQDPKVINCETCGFAHLLPIPSQSDLDSYYASDYYASTKPSCISDRERDFSWWQRVYEDRIRSISQYLSSDQRTILDIGSGTGHFLLVAQQLNWHSVGIEPSKQAYDYCIQQTGVFNVCHSTFEKWNKVTRKPIFSAIHMQEVLEHLPDPRTTLRSIHKLLVPGGILCIVVPNDFSPVQYAATSILKLPPWWIVPEHINYFTPSTLTSLLERCSYEIIDLTTTYPIDLSLLFGFNYVSGEHSGAAIHQARKDFEHNLDEIAMSNLYRSIYKALSTVNVGREIVIIARKK